MLQYHLCRSLQAAIQATRFSVRMTGVKALMMNANSPEGAGGPVEGRLNFSPEPDEDDQSVGSVANGRTDEQAKRARTEVDRKPAVFAGRRRCCYRSRIRWLMGENAMG